jgi:hypothetical protein
MDSTAYYSCLKEFDFSASSYEEIATYLMKNGVKEMYHALVNEADIPAVLAIPNFKIFWCCRCHVVEDDESTGHEHWHALVQFEGDSLVSYKKRLQRAKLRLHPKTTFKRIICPDHAVGVLRYICCKDGQRQTRRGQDGLMGRPHTHYERSVFGKSLLHVRGKHCGPTRDAIYDQITAHVSTSWMLENGYGGHNKELHNYKTCRCDRGEVGMENKRIANQKRRDFYKTDEGKAVKKNYREKNATKRQIMAELSKFGVNKKAKLCQESIAKLMSML